MVEPMTVMAIAGAASSAYGGMKAGKDAKDAAAKRDRLQERGLNLLEGELTRQRGLFGPMEQRMAADLSSDTPRNWGLIKGDIESNYQNADRATGDYLRSMGQEGGGLGAAITQGSQLNKGRDMSRAYQDALRAQKADRLNFLARYNPAGLVGAVTGQGNLMAGTANQDMLMNKQDEAAGYAGFANGMMAAAAYAASRKNPGVTPSAPEKVPVPSQPMKEETIQPIAPTNHGFMEGRLAPRTTDGLKAPNDFVAKRYPWLYGSSYGIMR